MRPAIAETLAAGVAIVHAAVLAIYIAGAVSVLRGRFCRARLLIWQRGYLAIVLALAVTAVCTDTCPLTRLENVLRAASNPAACYRGSYLEYHVPVLSPLADQIASLVLLTIGGFGALGAFTTWLRSQAPLPRRA
jgi:hypothetical protein